MAVDRSIARSRADASTRNCSARSLRSTCCCRFPRRRVGWGFRASRCIPDRRLNPAQCAGAALRRRRVAEIDQDLAVALRNGVGGNRVAANHCLAGREVEFPSFRSAPRTESLQTLCWREMDSNRRSSAEFGNFVLAGVSFGVSQSSNGLSDRTCHALCCAAAPANDLFAGNDDGAIAIRSCSSCCGFKHIMFR